MSKPEVDNAVDNDVLLKAVCFGLRGEFWPKEGRIGVLGAAKYVLADAVTSEKVKGDPKAFLEALDEFVEEAERLEPTEAETAFAAELVLLAQRNNLALDTGEGQLAAMVVCRGIASLVTGDKRAVLALETLIGLEPRLASLAGRVVCLEQLVAAALVDDEAFERVRADVCAEPDIDKALSICFACVSMGSLSRKDALDALSSYVESLRKEAPTVLAS